MRACFRMLPEGPGSPRAPPPCVISTGGFRAGDGAVGVAVTAWGPPHGAWSWWPWGQGAGSGPTDSRPCRVGPMLPRPEGPPVELPRCGGPQAPSPRRGRSRPALQAIGSSKPVPAGLSRWKIKKNASYVWEPSGGRWDGCQGPRPLAGLWGQPAASPVSLRSRVSPNPFPHGPPVEDAAESGTGLQSSAPSAHVFDSVATG